ncbi:hypothetical protein VTN77DRAFT_4591 [Rasamsonia byssochlamydoides]|uniref:uncharacterized protein n=1 Tax=Rasamsonia byssochlamydoides TaxID=89139 RepID=UPI003743F088
MASRQPPAASSTSTAGSAGVQKPKVLSPEEIKELGSRRVAPPPRPKDIRQTPEYKAAARRWISTIVALPILFVTSWVLYERVYGGKKPKHLIERSQPQPPTPASESEK